MYNLIIATKVQTSPKYDYPFSRLCYPICRLYKISNKKTLSIAIFQ